MIACLDACVLYPTVMREMLLGVASNGAFAPVWSVRILEEWRRAIARKGAVENAIAEGEIARLRASWPNAIVDGEATPDMWLPDAADIHVLATAKTAGAEVIVTLNLRDFPTKELVGHGLRAEHPDAFLRRIWAEDRQPVTDAARAVRAEAERLSGHRWEMRDLLKKAGLPRTGKALGKVSRPRTET